MPERTRRRLTAIVSTDVVGYSRLVGENETGTLVTLPAHRDDLIHPRRYERDLAALREVGLPD